MGARFPRPGREDPAPTKNVSLLSRRVAVPGRKGAVRVAGRFGAEEGEGEFQPRRLLGNCRKRRRSHDGAGTANAEMS
jgi:hypothetical protein